VAHLIHSHPHLVKAEHIDHVPQYTFGYKVHDPTTGDSKHQVESRLGDVVRGQYALVEADGSHRVVNYYADDLNGFNAVVHKDGHVAPIALAHKTIVGSAIAPTFAHKTILTAHEPILKNVW
jgi:hypothetical protein